MLRNGVPLTSGSDLITMQPEPQHLPTKLKMSSRIYTTLKQRTIFSGNETKKRKY